MTTSIEIDKVKDELISMQVLATSIRHVIARQIKTIRCLTETTVTFAEKIESLARNPVTRSA